MKKIFLLILSTSGIIAACTQPAKDHGDQLPEFIEVEARPRVHPPNDSIYFAEYKKYKTKTVDHLKGYEQEVLTSEDLSPYGGWKKMRVEPRGFFYTKKINNRWWLIDPEGYLFYNIALNSVYEGSSERNQRVLKEKFGSYENWATETYELIRKNGFNCSGAWSDTTAIFTVNQAEGRPIPYVINLGFMRTYGRTAKQKDNPNKELDVFNPEFREFCHQHAKKLALYKDDPYLLGYFSDNELPFRVKRLPHFLSLPQTDHGYLAAKKWIDAKGIKEEGINKSHEWEFMTYVGETYFSIVLEAIRKYDPNHLYLGSRFNRGEKHHENFMRKVSKYIDVFSMNYYNHWTPDPQHLEDWSTWMDKPFLITEFYTKGEDTGLPNTSGAGWIVKTQRDRGLFYQNYTLSLVKSKHCVGWHYFKYQDNDPTNKNPNIDASNINSNKGIVDNDYEPYVEMLREMNKVNHQVYYLIEYFDRGSNGQDAI